MADIRTSGASALTFSFSTQALTIGNPSQAIARLDDDERGLTTVETPSGAQEMGIINESGLYSLILTSRKPEAKKFKKWVTAEVLPAIRKTGRYESQAAQPQHAAREQLNAADLQNLKRLIWLVADRMNQKEVWSQAIWFHLRQVLNNPAPNPFYVDHLPAMQRELIQVLNTAIQVKQITRQIEQDAARRIFRRGETADSVLAALDLGAQHDMARLKSSLTADFSWIEQDLLKLTQRAQPYMGVYYVADEQPDFFLRAA